MRIISQQAAHASRRTIVAATCWLAASIAIMAFSERIYAAPHVVDTVAFVPPVIAAPDADDIRLLVYRQDPLGRPLNLHVVRRTGDGLGVETGTTGFRDRRDLNILAAFTRSRRVRSRHPRTSHSRLRRMSEDSHTDVRVVPLAFVTLAAGW